MARHTHRTYYPGDHLVICDRCGFKRYRSECRKEWQGFLVCADTCWEPRHPQDLSPPYRLDRQWVEDNRPPQPITTTVSKSFVAQDFTAFVEVDPNALMTVVSTQVDLTINTQQNASLFKDYGQDYFQDFRIRYTLLGSGTDANPSYAVCVLSDYTGFGQDFYPFGIIRGCGIWIQLQSSVLTARMFETNGLGTVQWVGSALTLSVATDYFFELKRVNKTLTLERYTDSNYGVVAETATGDQIYSAWHQYLIWPTIAQSSPGVSSATITVKNLTLETETITKYTGDDL